MDRLVLWHRVFPPTRLAQDAPETIATWIDTITDRLRRASGVLLSTIGSTTAVAFDLIDINDVLNIALRLLDDVEESDIGALGASVGIATGDLITHDGRLAGSAIDRAQLMACRARKGEIVVDAATKAMATDVFLFGRSVGTGAAALRGHTIDRTMPHRSSCRATIAKLGPPSVAPVTRKALAVVREIAFLGRGCAVLRGPHGGGACEYIQALEEELAPPIVLRLGNVPGALEPFGSLRLALQRAFDRPEKIADRLGDALAAAASGTPVPPEDIRDALVEKLDGGWIIFDPVPSIDPSTITLMANVIENAGIVAIARVPIDAPLPKPLRALSWHDVVLPSLRVDDAKKVAQSVLGEGADKDVVRRVAVLGGDTPLGVLEAARTLVSVGDLIHDGSKFVWRISARAGVRSIATEDLLAERLAGLEQAPLRMLEAVCMTSPGTPRLLVAAVAQRDGLSMEVRREASERLRTEGWIHGGTQLLPTSELLRRLVLNRMPPARTAELCRFTVEAMRGSSLFEGELIEATLGYYLAEGGDTLEGAEAMIRVAEATLAVGYRNAPRRLAAAAVQIHPLEEVRAHASRIARAAQSVDGVEQSKSEGRISQLAVSALLAGDIDTVERTIEAAIAEGRDLAAAGRMRAMAHLVQGDPDAAMKALSRLRRPESEDPHLRARSSLTLAWIYLHAGDAEEGVRACLDALSAAREVKDPRGETAALHTMAACYRSLDRDTEADLLADAAPA